MSVVSPDPHPLPRAGLDQRGRDLRELQPSHAPVDGRVLADDLVFLLEMARRLRFFDEMHPVVEDVERFQFDDWAGFFERNPLVRCAQIARIRVDSPVAGFDRLMRLVDAATGNDRRLALRALATFVAEQVGEVDGWTAWLPPDHRFVLALDRTIASGLGAATGAAVGLHKALFGDLWEAELAALGSLHGESWGWTLSTAAASPSTGDLEAELFAALAATFERLKEARRYLVDVAARLVVAGPGACGDHEPHIGLTLSFLEQLAAVRAQVDGLTARHLEFYFRRVLQIPYRAAEPDSAHVLFEPARNAGSARMGAGRELSAGDLTYALSGEVVVSHGSVAAVRSTFLIAAGESPTGRAALRACPVADSSDGLGAALPAEAPGWLGLGGHAEHGEVGTVGFAIAAPVLRASGGSKTITIDVALAEPAVAAGLTVAGALQVSVTSAEGWMAIDAPVVSATAGGLRIVLPVDRDRPVADFDPALHDLAPGRLPVLTTSWPVVRVLLDCDVVAADTGAGARVTDITCELSVSEDPLLAVQNDQGTVDPGKPFFAFGAMPKVGSGMAVGSAEVFGKELRSLTLHLEWMNAPGDLGSHYAAYVPTLAADQRRFEMDVELLAGGTWRHLTTTAVTTGSVALSAEPLTLARPRPGPVFSTALTTATTDGFVRLKLRSPPFAFGHFEYPSLFTNYVLGKSAGETPCEPNRPWTPELSRVTVSYVARETLASAAPDGSGMQLFHLGSHGWWDTAGEADRTLLPAFDAESELLIGLQGFAAGASASLLVQVLEGSEDVFVPRPELRWSYLADNQWQPLPDDHLMLDTTDGLLRSGILQLILPVTAGDNETRMPRLDTATDLRWLRVAVPDNSRAIGRLVAIEAQAGVAALATTDLPDEHFDAPLPASSIQKLASPDSGIKAVRQPYAGFGGRAAETAATPFFRRVSERLRHKDRAVTLWDYEHLVLERFPELHRVKCINHADRRSERAPGSVLFVVVPRLDNRNAVDPYRPAVSQATLSSIRAFLQEHHSAWVDLEVINPTFEPVQVEVGVALYAGRDPDEYRRQVALDLRGFFTPWLSRAGGDAVFGQSVYRSEVVHFIETLDYVDYVVKLKLRQVLADGTVRRDVDELRTSRESSILTSHPEHQVTVEVGGGGT